MHPHAGSRPSGAKVLSSSQRLLKALQGPPSSLAEVLGSPSRLQERPAEEFLGSPRRLQELAMCSFQASTCWPTTSSLWPASGLGGMRDALAIITTRNYNTTMYRQYLGSFLVPLLLICKSELLPFTIMPGTMSADSSGRGEPGAPSQTRPS